MPVSEQQMEPVGHWPHIFIWSMLQWGTLWGIVQASAVQAWLWPPPSHTPIKLQLVALTAEHPPVLVQQILPAAQPVH